MAAVIALVLPSACTAQRSIEAPHIITYRCSDERTFSVEQGRQSARVDFDDEHFRLPRRASTIGVRYASQDATLIIDGDMAVFVTKQIWDLQSCRALQA